MPTKIESFRDEVIVPTLRCMGYNTPNRVQLLLGTALHESAGLRYRKQIKGPAISFYQIEPATFQDIWKNYLNYRLHLLERVQTLQAPFDLPLEALRYNDYFATAVACVFYLRIPEKLPKYGDILGQAQYWKKYYNTVKGKGTVEAYLESWNSYVHEH